MNEFYKFGRKIIGIGKNYALVYLDNSDHAKEMGGSVPKVPMFFLKPTSSYLLQPGQIEIPKDCIVHHEGIFRLKVVELGVVIGKDGKHVAESKAMDLVSGYVLGLDMTARNVQEAARKQGYPWTVAKGYDTFSPISSFVERSKIKDPHELSISLKVNDVLKQNGSTRDMYFKYNLNNSRIPQLIAFVSSIMKLEKGDMILTGTPAGVGPVNPGDVLVGTLKQGDDQVATFKFKVKN